MGATRKYAGLRFTWIENESEPFSPGYTVWWVSVGESKEAQANVKVWPNGFTPAGGISKGPGRIDVDFYGLLQPIRRLTIPMTARQLSEGQMTVEMKAVVRMETEAKYREFVDSITDSDEQ